MNLTLHQRLAAIEAEVRPVEPTGTNEYKKPALSIRDVEEALRPLFAEYRVLTLWHRKALERMDARLWRAELVCRMVNADDPADSIETEWEDVGSNPSAAYSFTRKGYYKATFHLADKEDDSATDSGQPKTQPKAREPSRPQTTLAQRIAMAAKELGLTTKQDRDRLRQAAVGKSDDLTSDEAHRVLAAIDAIRAGRAVLRQPGDDEPWEIFELPPEDAPANG